jgi:hypothetical protein
MRKQIEDDVGQRKIVTGDEVVFKIWITVPAEVTGIEIIVEFVVGNKQKRVERVWPPTVDAEDKMEAYRRNKTYQND